MEFDPNTYEHELNSMMDSIIIILYRHFQFLNHMDLKK